MDTKPVFARTYCASHRPSRPSIDITVVNYVLRISRIVPSSSIEYSKYITISFYLGVKHGSVLPWSVQGWVNRIRRVFQRKRVLSRGTSISEDTLDSSN